MIETLPMWGQIVFWVLILFFSHFLAFVAGYENAKKFWSDLLNSSRKSRKEMAIKYQDRVGELADKIGGKCTVCKGWGVLGEDGSSDCMNCCGTGVRDLSHLADQNRSIINRAIKDCDTTKKQLEALLVPLKDTP